MGHRQIQGEVRQTGRSSGWYFHSEHWRCIHCHLRWHRHGMCDIGIRILVLSLSLRTTNHGGDRTGLKRKDRNENRNQIEIEQFD